MAKKINRNYSIDYVRGIIKISREYERRAGQIESTEYNNLKQLLNDHPYMRIERKTVNRKRGGQVRISYIAMETYIGCLQNSARWFQDYLTVRNMSATQESPYIFVRKWFQDTFPDYRKSPVFDQEGLAIVTIREMDIQNSKPNENEAA